MVTFQLAPPGPRKDVCSTVGPPPHAAVATVHCTADFVTIDIYSSADGHMAKTNNLQPLDVSVIAASMRVVGRVHSPSVVTVAGTGLFGIG